jgi:F-type H+-transporting ATPase subunit gamma
MPDAADLRTRIDSATTLLSVVRTMKSMASVDIHQYERAVEALRTYVETIELGLEVVVRERPDLVETATSGASHPVAAVVLGSDQGMCGSFNERIASHARGSLTRRDLPPETRHYVLLGHRIGFHFDDERSRIATHREMPSSIEGLPDVVRMLLRALDNLRQTRDVERVLVYYNTAREGGRIEPATLELLPVDRAFLERLASREWQSRTEPTFTMESDDLLMALIREYLYVSLVRACAESLAAENAARLSAMQSAERNISDRLDELRRAHRRARQSAITTELLDIVGGFEALSDESD